MRYRDLDLDRFQVRAIEHLQADRTVLVSAPTGTGKTLIADWIVEQRLAEGREVIYTAPVKALSNQKFRDYTAMLGEDRVGLVTGDMVIRPGAPLRIMTTEILRNMLLVGERLDHLATVVIDEIHFLDDPERGTVWEELLIYLPATVQVLGLSATLSNLDEIAGWLESVRDTEVAVVREDRRAVPLQVSLANRFVQPCGVRQFDDRFRRWVSDGKSMRKKRPRHWKRGRGKRPGPRGRQPTAERDRPTRPDQLVERLEPDLLPCLYFVYSRRTCEDLARELSRRRRHGLLTGEQPAEVEGLLIEFEEGHPGVMSGSLRGMLLRGIAYHHAGLHVNLKALVEQLYERRLIQVLYCTTTFALGINMPARTVAIHTLDKYDGRGFVPLTVREFQQMAGRAGRRGIDRKGHAILRLDFPGWHGKRKPVARLLEGRPEPVTSSFNLSFNSVVNLLDRYEQDEVKELLRKSLLAYQLQHGSRAREHRRFKRVGADAVWMSFQRKVFLLQNIGYLDGELEFNAGAAVLRHIQIEEIFATELVLTGALESLPPALLFAALCAVVTDLGPSVKITVPRGKMRQLAAMLEEIYLSDPVARTEEEQSGPTSFGPELIPLAAAWYSGEPLMDIVERLRSSADISGVLVNALRRGKDLAGQLRDVYRAAEDDEMVARLNEVVRTVSRDEVEVVG